MNTRRPHVSKCIGQLLIVPAGLRAEHSADSVVCFVSTQAFGLSDRRCWHERDHLSDRTDRGGYGHSFVPWIALAIQLGGASWRRLPPGLRR